MRIMDRMEALRTYLRDAGLSQSAFAETLGVYPSLVCRWLKGEQKPRFDMMVRIARETRGAVPLDAWVDKDQAA